MATKKKVQRKAEVKLTIGTYPLGTENIYVCGSCLELGEWQANKAVKLTKNENNEYELNLHLTIGNIIEYKFLSNRSWDCVECGVVAIDMPNRTITVNGDKIVCDEVRGFMKASVANEK